MSDANERPTLSFTKTARKIREVLDKTRRACDPNDPDCPWREEKVRDLANSDSR